MKRWLAIGWVLLAALPAAQAQEAGRYYFQTSLMTRHFEPKAEHNNQQNLLNVERHWSEGVLAGGAHFRNSFDQPTQYVYVGKRYTLPHTGERLYAKVTAGVLYGYKGEYKDQIPFNGYGIAPVVLPALGMRGKQLGGELVVFGTAGAMLTLGFPF